MGDVLLVAAPAAATIGFLVFVRAGWVHPSERLLLRVERPGFDGGAISGIL